MKEATLNAVLGTYSDYRVFLGNIFLFDGVRFFLPLNEMEFRKIT